jgi:hypothetical protein
MAGSDSFSWRKLLEWRTGGPLFDRLLITDRQLDDKQRTIALDMAAILTPRASRFFAAVTVLTLGPDKKIADATRKLTPAVTDLLEVIGANPKKFDSARVRAQKALGDFRAVADQRDR